MDNSPSVHVLAASTGGRGVFEILIKPSTLSGAVFQGSPKQPVAAATVFLDVTGKGSAEESMHKTVTGADGKFAFSSLPPGTFTLRVVPPANCLQTPDSVKTFLLNGSNVTQDLQIEPELTIKPATGLLPSIRTLLPGQTEEMPHSGPGEV
jgi:hypothetical protein